MRAYRPLASFTLCFTVGIEPAAAGLLEDSHATVDFRNLYFDRDFRQSGGNTLNGLSQAREWGQGIVFQLQSGFSDGPVGFGLDSILMSGFRLDSTEDRAGTGMFPKQSNGRSVDEFSRAGVSAKMKVSKTSFRSGVMTYKKPVIQSADSRLLPVLLKGTTIESHELTNLTIHAARFTEAMALDSSSWEKLTSRFGGGSDKFVLYGADYDAAKNVQIRFYQGELDGIYKQSIANAIAGFDLTKSQRVSMDIRLAKGSEVGSFRGIDNKAYGALLGYRFGSQTISFGYQKMDGKDAYPYVNGTDPYLVNFIQILQFSNAGERSRQVRYDLDLAAWGIPGLSFMTRYVTGDHIQLSQGSEGREWERNTDISYVIQSGQFKNFSVRWRNATVRSSFGNDIDENRIIVAYPLTLF
ncbi:OprD family porin [Pseudomonas fluorescens]|uniref:Porin-like protein NicP n=1 Tax=Pseudomonas fluorescens TaxID=294 RepID=A0A5E7DP92_PSEFL|nr:OprD family porin [Pseudomonas fluorescens]VVO19429.1 Porin-like protein NicP [Pseudomonas fluorescens]